MKLLLSNPKRPKIEAVQADALVDTGSVFLIIPEHVRIQIQLDEQDKEEVTPADGGRRLVPSVEPVEARFKNRVAFVGALGMGDEVLLGAIPMEDMDLVLLPGKRLADVNPQRPNVATARAK